MAELPAQLPAQLPLLTYLEILEVAKRISTEDQVRELGANLGLKHYMVNQAIADNRKVIQAAHDVIVKWRSHQGDGVQARQDLAQALINSGEGNIAVQVFGITSEGVGDPNTPNRLQLGEVKGFVWRWPFLASGMVAILAVFLAFLLLMPTDQVGMSKQA